MAEKSYHPLLKTIKYVPAGGGGRFMPRINLSSELERMLSVGVGGGKSWEFKLLLPRPAFWAYTVQIIFTSDVIVK